MDHTEATKIAHQLAERVEQGLDPLAYTETDYVAFLEMKSEGFTERELSAYFGSLRSEQMQRRENSERPRVPLSAIGQPGSFFLAPVARENVLAVREEINRHVRRIRGDE